MSFDPLGGWNPAGPLTADALSAAKALALPAIPTGKITRVYLHWSVEGWLNCSSLYNYVVDLRDGKWVMLQAHDPRDNAPGLNDNTPAYHTWERNTGAIGIAINGMDGATEQNFGPDGVQRHELEFLCALAARVCKEYGIDANGTVSPPGGNHPSNDGVHTVNTTGEHNILTHGECAVIDGYPDERWDLGSFVAIPAGVPCDAAMRTTCGNALRTRIHLYKAQL